MSPDCTDFDDPPLRTVVVVAVAAAAAKMDWRIVDWQCRSPVTVVNESLQVFFRCHFHEMVVVVVVVTIVAVPRFPPTMLLMLRRLVVAIAVLVVSIDLFVLLAIAISEFGFLIHLPAYDHLDISVPVAAMRCFLALTIATVHHESVRLVSYRPTWVSILVCCCYCCCLYCCLYCCYCSHSAEESLETSDGVDPLYYW